MKKILLIFGILAFTQIISAQLVQKADSTYIEPKFAISFDSAYCLISEVKIENPHYANKRIKLVVDLYFSKTAFLNGYSPFDKKIYYYTSESGVNTIYNLLNTQSYNYLINNTGLGNYFENEN